MAINKSYSLLLKSAVLKSEILSYKKQLTCQVLFPGQAKLLESSHPYTSGSELSGWFLLSAQRFPKTGLTAV